MRDDELMSAIEHHKAGRFDDAERVYLRLYQANPSDSEVIFLIGVLCCDLGLFEAACRFLEEALTLRPAFPNASAQLAIALTGQARLDLLRGDAAAAEVRLEASLSRRENHAESLNWLGLAQLQQGKFADAEIPLRRVLELQPDHNQARNNLGLALLEQGRHAESEGCFEAALAQDPGYTNARVNFANALRVRGRHSAAREQLEAVLAVQPDSVEALNNLGTVAQDCGDVELALTLLTRALALSPDSPRIRWNLALAQLQRGDFKNGWSHFESRWEGCANLRGGYGMPKDRAWRGEPLHGKRLLLWAEQGFGDTLQFIRFAQDAAQLGATVSVLAQPEVAALMHNVPGVSEVAAHAAPAPTPGAPLPAYDFHCPLMSLPHRLGITLDQRALHGDRPYISAAPDKADHWRRRLAGYSGLRVGLVWAGSSRHHSAELAAIDARRSIPLREWAPILAVSGCGFFSLQKGLCASEFDSAAAPAARIHDFSGEWADFSDTAAVIMNLDLVISVDTAVAHLAGAMGKPVWLLNRYDTCWRWLQVRGDTPWYSRLRQFRQPEPGAWGPVVAEVAAELAARAARSNYSALLAS